MTTPPVTSLWPFRYFVALCIDDVDAERQRLLVDRARKGVVDHRQHAPARARRGDAADVHAAQRRIDRRLEPDACVVRSLITRLGRRELLERREPRRRSPNFVSRSFEQMQRPAVDRRAADDLVARRRVGHQERRRRALARREQQRLLGAIERRQLALDADDRRVGVARVQILRRAPFVVRRAPPARSRRRTSPSRRSASSAAPRRQGPSRRRE